MLYCVSITSNFLRKVLRLSPSPCSLGLKPKQFLNEKCKFRSLDGFRFCLVRGKYTILPLSLDAWAPLNKMIDLSYYTGSSLSAPTPKLDLSWMRVLSDNTIYALWLLFFKLRASQISNAVKLLGREFHTFSKIYGKSVRKNRLTPQQGFFFFDVQFGLGVFKLSKLDCKETFTPLVSSLNASFFKSDLVQTYEAGFFFPSFTLKPNQPTQSAKVSLEPYHSPKPLNSMLFTPALNLFRRKRKLLEKISLTHMSYGYTVYGGAQKSLRSPLLTQLKASVGNKFKARSSLVFRLLSLHKNSFFRSLKRKLRGASVSQTVSLKKVMQSGGGFKKKHNWAGLISKFSRKAVNSLFFTYQTGSSMFLKNSQNYLAGRDVKSNLNFKSGELVTSDSKKTDVFFKQPLVRYKPGLMRYWRAHRFFFQKYFSLGSRFRQKRLTRYIAKLSNVSSFSLYKAIELSVLHVIRTSQLILDLSLGQLWVFLDKTYISINGVRAYNPYLQVYTGDILFINTFGVSETSLRHNIHLQDVRLKSKNTKLKLCPGAFDTKLTLDNPSHLEVDELTSTLVILNEPNFHTYGDNFAAYQLPFITFRMYNWKYVV